MDDNQRELFEQKMEERLERGFLFTGHNAIAKFRHYVAQYVDTNNGGRVSSSAFEIVEKALVESGELGRPIVFDDKTSEIERKLRISRPAKYPFIISALHAKPIENFVTLTKSTPDWPNLHRRGGDRVSRLYRRHSAERPTCLVLRIGQPTGSAQAPNTGAALG